MLFRVNRALAPAGNFYTVTRYEDGAVLLSTYAALGAIVEAVGERSEVYFDWPHDPATDTYDVEAGSEVSAPSEEE